MYNKGINICLNEDNKCVILLHIIFNKCIISFVVSHVLAERKICFLNRIKISNIFRRFGNINNHRRNHVKEHYKFIGRINKGKEKGNKCRIKLHKFYECAKSYILKHFKWVLNKSKYIYFNIICHLKNAFFVQYTQREYLPQNIENYIINILPKHIQNFNPIKWSYNNNEYDNKYVTINNLNFIKYKNKYEKQYDIEMEEDINYKGADDIFYNSYNCCNNNSKRDDKIEKNTVDKNIENKCNIKEYDKTNKNILFPIEEEFKKIIQIENNIKRNYMVPNESNKNILYNLKNILEKIRNIEAISNINNYIDVKNTIESYKFNPAMCKEISHEDKYFRNKSKLCLSCFHNIIHKIIYYSKMENISFSDMYKQLLTDYNNTSCEYCSRINNAINGNNNLLTFYNDDNIYNWEYREKNKYEALENEIQRWNFNSSYGNNFPHMQTNSKIYRRILNEENEKTFNNVIGRNEMENDELYKRTYTENNYTNQFAGNNGDFDVYSDIREYNNDNEKYMLDENEIEEVKKRGKYQNLNNIDFNNVNKKYNHLKDDNIIIFNKNNMYNSLYNNGFNDLNLEKNNILFPYEKYNNLDKNEMNLAKYSQNKQFYGQYKYDGSIYKHDLIVLDTSGYIYKVSTDGTYHWKYRIVKNIQDYINYEEENKIEKYYNTLKNNNGKINMADKDILSNDDEQNHELKLRAMQKLQHNDSNDVFSLNYKKNDPEYSKEQIAENDDIDKKKNYSYEKSKKKGKKKKAMKRLLSDYSGDLFYVDENNEAIPININIKDVVNNSPFKSTLFPNILFIGSRQSSIINLDFDTGYVIKKYDENYDDLVKENQKALPNKHEQFIKKNSNMLHDKLENYSDHSIDINDKNYYVDEENDELDEDYTVIDDDDIENNQQLDYIDLYDDEIETENNNGRNNLFLIDEDGGIKGHSPNNEDEINTYGASSMLDECGTENCLNNHSKEESEIVSNKFNKNTRDKLLIQRTKIKNKRLSLMKNWYMNISNNNLLNTNSSDLGINQQKRNTKKGEKGNKKRKIPKRQLQISLVKWVIKAVDETSLKQKWITSWVDVGSIFIADNHKQDLSYINSLIDIDGNKLILKGLENNKVSKPYNNSIAKNIEDAERNELEFASENYKNDIPNEIDENNNKMENNTNKLNSNIKSKIFIFSKEISSVFALQYKSKSNIFTLDTILKQNEKLFPEYDSIKPYSYNLPNLKNNNNALLLPFSSSNDYLKNDDKQNLPWNFNYDENGTNPNNSIAFQNYNNFIAQRLNNISINITSIEKDLRYLLLSIIFAFDKHKKIPMNYILQMKTLLHEYQQTKQKFMICLRGLNHDKNINIFSNHNDIRDIDIKHYGYDDYDYLNKDMNDVDEPIHICEYTNKLIDLSFEGKEKCIDYCSMLNIWDKIFNNYTNHEDCLLLSNVYRILNSTYPLTTKDFTRIIDGIFQKDERMLIKRRRKSNEGSRNNDLTEFSSPKYKKSWYWNIFYAIALVIVVPFVFIYRLFKKQADKNSRNKIFMRKKKITDYDEDSNDAYDELLNIDNILLKRNKRKLANILKENGISNLNKAGLEMFMAKNLKKAQDLEHLTLVDILARHARDSDSDSNFYDIHDGKYNLYPHYYSGQESKYSLPNMHYVDLNKSHSGETNKYDLDGNNMFYMHRRRAASQDVTYKQSFIVKKRIRSNYKIGNKYNKRNYTDYEKDKKNISIKGKSINEKAFDKNDFINFLKNYNKKFMKKNPFVDHLMKTNKTDLHYEFNNNKEKAKNLYNEKFNFNSADEENKSPYSKKYFDEKKYKSKSSKYIEGTESNNNDNINGNMNAGNHINNINNDKISNKGSSGRNLSIIQTSHIPYDAPLADFLENGRFMRTFQNISLIGQGGFGSVYKVSHRLEPGSPTYALKFIYLKVSSLDNVSSRRYFREIAANRDIYSKHVVRYYTWWCEEPQFLPMDIIPKEIQNTLKKNKDPFKKVCNKNKKDDDYSSDYTASSVENNKFDLKNYKKVITKKNSIKLKFYSDNDTPYNKRKDNTQKNAFLNDKNLSDNIYIIENNKKKKKKKKRKKKIIYKEKKKGNIDMNCEGNKYSTFYERNNPNNFSSNFQEYDPFGYGYLSENERDLIVFADNDESNGSAHSKKNDNDERKSASNQNEICITGGDISKNDNAIHDDSNILVCQKSDKNSMTIKNAPGSSTNGTLNRDTLNDETRTRGTNNNPKDSNDYNIDTIIKQKGESFALEGKIPNNKYKKNGLGIINTNRKLIEENNKKEKGQEKEKDKLKMNGELEKKENANKIKYYKKKNTGPEFSIVLLLQMEFCKGSTLRRWLDRPSRSDKPLHFTYGDKNTNHPLEFDLFKQLIKGLKDIHSTCFIHRDLKPENIFVDLDTYILKIGDLGLVRFIEEKKRENDLSNIDNFKDNIYTEINHNTITSQISLKGQMIGTPGYTAPEGGALCDEKADIYSAALILLELLCPRFNTIMERYKTLNDFRNYYTVPDYVKIHLNPWYILMLQMSKPNPADRPSAADLYNKIKVLLDPHLTDFTFSFNDINNDDLEYTGNRNVINSTSINGDIKENVNQNNLVDDKDNNIISGNEVDH
ncbi:eukaryotic translation initiation factor 2-alpha kinase, putative [Plasmodium chabaudi adami]|uniref:Eukaryotic translation initiation factor 2-alpha kinase PK4 n=1 Tax=Plasmodium chabaudi adami TaxID=5826 RepID=A0A1D3RYC7_PLACE|nr:eukaryotic translation initiation factor 2-alpha kinase, putative [Plasmodium chabaudi adami]